MISIALPCVDGFRTLTVTALGTFSERLARLLGSESIDNAENAEDVDFYIPLAPFERRLLDLVDERGEGDLLATGLSGGSIDALLPHLFHNWAWSYTVQSCLQDAFTTEDDIEKCENYRQMYDKGLHRMGWRSGYGREQFRFPPLRESNHDFLERLGSKPFWNIRFKPLDKDAKYWAILARMFLLNKPLMLFWMNAAERRRIFSTRNEVLEWHHSHYHIGQIVRIFDLWSRRPSNSEDIANLFSNVNYSALFELSMRRARQGDNLVSYPRAADPTKEAEATESEDGGTSAESSNLSRVIEILNQAINANGASMEVILDSQIGTMRWHYANLLYTTIRPIDVFQDEPWMATQEEEERGHNHAELNRTREELRFEPGSYLELVDWDELVPVALKDISQRARQDLADSRLKVEYDLVVWRASQTPCISYHFASEDTLMQRRLCNGFDDAGDCDDGHIFLLVDFEGSSFGSDCVYYWALWNDSALTVEPETKKLKVLTSPRGCRYRRIYADFDELAALRSQRREVDLASSSKETRSFLQHILGAAYKPEYDTMLPYIPAEQISVLSPVGAGSFGSVVKATWQRPPSLEHDEAETVDVVLKRLHSDFQASKAFGLFIHEDVLAPRGLLGLTGSSTGCTQFYGVTEIDAASFPGVDGSGTCLCFVFERANAGYLSEHIKQKCLSQAWPEVASAMASLFGGLDTLHRRDVLHRDIHPGNILLTMQRSGYSGTEPAVCLCDFGLGKIVKDPSAPGDPTTGTMQTNPASSAYKAPEVRLGQPYTKAADIYAAGVFMLRAFDCFRRAASGPAKLPRKLWKLCEQCTASEPEKRMTAIQAVFEMEHVHDDDFADGEFDLVDMRELLKRGAGLGEASSAGDDTPGSTELDSRFNVVMSPEESGIYGS
ncbi:hypothetical protein NW759_014963 [Fusarium solani]|nr:hypothetical protein NW759_014963 [Fusarium solani]